MLERGDEATLWGIDRIPGSPLCGKLACPVINLWNSAARNRVVASLPHKMRVKILDSTHGPDGRVYYRIEGYVGEGERRSGWVSCWFIKEHEI